VRTACLALGLLMLPAAAQAQIWPLQVGPSADVIDQSQAQFDRFRRNPQAPRTVLPAQPAVYVPAWTPPPMQPPRSQPTIRRAATPPRQPTAVAAAPEPAPPVGRAPNLEAVERRLAERERILRDLQRELLEERRLVDEWRGERRASR